MLISAMTPSRGRPEMMRRMAKSMFSTMSKENELEIAVWLDDDDPALSDYMVVCSEYSIRYLVGPRNVIHSSRWDRCLPLVEGELLLHANDDIVLGTPDWDKMVVAEFAKFPDRILMVHGDDLFCQRQNFGCHPIIHRRWLETVGYFIPDCFDGEYGDTVVNFIANRIGRRRFLPFICEHLHYSRQAKVTCSKCGRDDATINVPSGIFCNACGHEFGNPMIDQTTIDYLARQQKQDPARIFKEREGDWLAAADKLKAVMIQDKSPVKFEILILTMPTRSTFLQRILGILSPQLTSNVRVTVRMCDPSLTLGENREIMRQNATGEYIAFIDDDDRVTGDYVSTILPLLDGIDIVGFECSLTMDGVQEPKRDFHTITAGTWYNTDDAFYRDISHLQPIRRDLALAAAMEGGHGEDGRWADKMRALGVVKTEHYIDKVMYFYEYRSMKNVGSPCPKCGRTCTVMVEEGTHCNGCGTLFDLRSKSQKSCLWF